jgi:hypothetical protein
MEPVPVAVPLIELSAAIVKFIFQVVEPATVPAPWPEIVVTAFPHQLDVLEEKL